MVNAGFLFLFLAGVSGVLSALPSDGWYTIRCQTVNAGERAWYQTKLDNGDYYIGTLAPGTDAKFHFYLKSTGTGTYRISHKTSDGTERSATAYSSTKYIVALQSKSDTQKQVWSVQDMDNGKFRVSCDAVGMGRKYVEAFPQSKELLLKDNYVNYQDQMFYFVKV